MWRAAALFVSAPALATSLDGMFRSWAADTWFIGTPLGAFATFFILLTWRAITDGSMLGVLWGLLAAPLAAGFLFWAALGLSDPTVILIVAIAVAGGVGLDRMLQAVTAPPR